MNFTSALIFVKSEFQVFFTHRIEQRSYLLSFSVLALLASPSNEMNHIRLAFFVNLYFELFSKLFKSD